MGDFAINSDNNFKDVSRENRHYYNNKPENKNENEMPVSKFQIVASQLIGTLTANLLITAAGCTVGFNSVFFGELIDQNSEISVKLESITWYYDSYFYMVLLGSLLGGFIAQYIGSRLLLITSALMFILSWLLYRWTNTYEIILFAQAINGLASGIVRAPSLVFIAEITQPYLRGTFMISAALFNIFGEFFPTLLEGRMHWRTIVLFNLIFPMVALLMWIILPNSPHWLANKNRINDSQRSLAWFRGWTSPECITSEMQTLNNENVENFTTTRIQNTRKSFLHRTFFIPLVTTCFIFFTSAFGGSKDVLSLLFRQIPSPVEQKTAYSIIIGLYITAIIFCMITIHLIGKRKLILFSTFYGGIIFIIVAIFVFLMESNYITTIEYYYLWVPTIGIILAVFVITAGIGSLMHVLNSELFSVSHRLIGSGLGQTFFQLINLLFNVSLICFDVPCIRFSGIFTIFAVINIMGFIILYFVLPETEGRTLKEIEEHFAGKRKIRT